MSFLRTVWNNHFNLPDLPPAGTFKDQSILITGASGGLGLATAVHFVNLGASSVIITARTHAKGEKAKAVIESQTNTAGKGIVKVMELEMGTFSGLKLFAEKVKAEVKTIDYVLLNAGVFNTKFKLGAEGYEESIQVNTLSTALLALLLLPWIKDVGRGTARLAFVTSGLHKTVNIEKFPKEDVLGFFSKEENFPGSNMYLISKLLEQYVANEISKLVLGPDGSPQVIVNPLCPGMVSSDIGRAYKDNIFMTAAVNVFMATCSKTAEGGARTPVLAALSPPADNGKYITHYQSDEDYKIAAQKAVVGPEGQRMQARVWEEIIGVLVDKFPEVKDIVHQGA